MSISNPIISTRQQGVRQYGLTPFPLQKQLAGTRTRAVPVQIAPCPDQAKARRMIEKHK